MALTAQQLIDRAALILLDATNVRWPAAELLGWVNDGRRELAATRPDVYSTTTSHALVAGVKQTLPTGAARLIHLTRNTDGAAVKLTQREWLDAFDPSWPRHAPARTIQHYMVEEATPEVFYVYPPAVAGASVELAYEATPVDYGAGSSLTGREELYAGALLDYVCFRAFSKDAEYVGAAERALAHYQRFAQAVGQGAQVNLMTSPNTQDLHGVPARTVAAG